MDINYSSRQGVFRTHIIALDYHILNKNPIFKEDFFEIISLEEDKANSKSTLINNLEKDYVLKNINTKICFLPKNIDGLTIKYRLPKYSTYLGSGKILSGPNEVCIAHIDESVNGREGAWFFSNYAPFIKKDDLNEKMSSYETFLKTLFIDENIKKAADYAINNYKFPINTFSKEDYAFNHFKVFIDDVIQWVINPEKDSINEKRAIALKEDYLEGTGLQKLSHKLYLSINETMNSDK